MVAAGGLAKRLYATDRPAPGIRCAASGDHGVPVDGGPARDLRAAAITVDLDAAAHRPFRHRPPARRLRAGRRGRFDRVVFQKRKRKSQERSLQSGVSAERPVGRAPSRTSLAAARCPQVSQRGHAFCESSGSPWPMNMPYPSPLRSRARSSTKARSSIEATARRDRRAQGWHAARAISPTGHSTCAYPACRSSFLPQLPMMICADHESCFNIQT